MTRRAGLILTFLTLALISLVGPILRAQEVSPSTALPGVLNLSVGPVGPPELARGLEQQDVEGGDVQLCWDSPVGDIAPVSYRVLATPARRSAADLPRRQDYAEVVTVPRQQRCWRGEDDLAQTWAVAPVYPSGAEGALTSPQVSQLRLLGRLPDAPTLENNTVQAIHEDSRGGLWFGTWGGGVSRYEPISGAWRTFRQADGLGSDDVQAIYEDGQGRIWFGTAGGGVSRYEPTSGVWHTFRQADGLGSDDVKAIHEDGQGRIWFTTAGGGVSRYDSTLGVWRTFRQADGLGSDTVSAIHEDSQGGIWFGTEAGGVSRYEPNREVWRTFRQADGLVDDDVRAIHEDVQGRIWFGTGAGGVSRYEPSSGTWHTLRLADGLGSDDVRAIYEDSREVLWFGTIGGGVSSYEPNSGAWRTFSQADGLGSVNVLAIHEDSRGALWFGTGGDGVSRYDQTSGAWHSFRQPDRLESDDVSAIHEDSRGALWFGMVGGVSRYEPSSGAWHTFYWVGRLASRIVNAIYEDRQGGIWFGTWGGGASHYNPASGAWRTFGKADELGDVTVNAIQEDSQGGIWFGTEGGGVSRYEPNNGAWRTFGEADGLGNDDVRAIHEDSQGRLWFGTEGRGVSRYDPKSETWQTIRQADQLKSYVVQAIHEDADGGLWFGTQPGGVIHFDTIKGKWNYLRNVNGPKLFSASAIHEDSRGGLWFGGIGWEGGMSRYDPKSGVWQNVRHAGERRHDEVLAIHEDNRGGLWSATRFGGVSRYEPNSGARHTFRQAVRPLSDSVNSIREDSRGGLWFGTNGGGVGRYDPYSGVWHTFRKADGLGDDTVKAIHEDSRGGLWFGTLGGGVSRYDPASGTWRTFRSADGLGSGVVQAIHEDSIGCLWFGTGSWGVSHYDPTSEVWRTFRKADGLASDDVTAIHEDSRGGLWFGTEGGGVSRYDPNGSAWRTFRQADGLGSDDVTAIHEDRQGVLWFGTKGGGVSRYEPNSGTWRTFRQADGLGSDDVRAIHEDSRGVLWFGTVYGGLSRYEPTREVWRTFSRADGLGDDSVKAIHEDSQGGLWFGTFYGLVRYTETHGFQQVDLYVPGYRIKGETVGKSSVLIPYRAAVGLVGESATGASPGGSWPVVGVARWDGHGQVFAQQAGDVFVVEPGGARVLHAPVNDPRLVQVQGARLCVGGGGLACTADGSAWERVALPESADEEGVASPMKLEDLTVAIDGTLWAVSADQVCAVSLGGAVYCLSTSLPGVKHRAVAPASTSAWVGTDSGLFRAAIQDGSVHMERVADPTLSTLQIWSLALEPKTGVLWIGSVGRGLLRYDPRAPLAPLLSWLDPLRGTVQVIGGGQDPQPGRHIPAGMPTPPPGSPVPATIDSVAYDGRGRVYAVQGDFLYDYPAPRGIPLAPVLAAWLLALGAVIWGGSRKLLPLAQAVSRDPGQLQRIPIPQLSAAIRQLRALAVPMGVNADDPRLPALRALSRDWDQPGSRLTAAARVLGLKPGEAAQDTLAVTLPELGLHLPDPHTLLVSWSASREPELRRLLASQPPARPVAGLVLTTHATPAELPAAAIPISEADLREIGWSADPATALTSLLWRRGDLNVYAPFQARGPVSDPGLFFGRAGELRQLLALAPDAEGGAALLIGPRRIGKSSLLLRVQRELAGAGRPVLYGALRREVHTVADLAAVLDPRRARAPSGDLRALAGGALLLLDEADLLFADPDRAALLETLRALVQEGTCGVILAGYAALFRASLSQREVVNNFGQPVFLGALDTPSAERLAQEPMARMGVGWADPELPSRLAQEVGSLPDLMQTACRLLLLRVRGDHAPTLDAADLDAVLFKHWRPPGEPDGLLDQVVRRVTTNVSGPAQAFVLSHVADAGRFSRADLAEALAELRFDGAAERVDEIAEVLVLAGVCDRRGDSFGWIVPLLARAVQGLDRAARVAELRHAWASLSPAERASSSFWEVDRREERG